MAAILRSGGGEGGGGDGVGDELRTALRMRNINNVLYEYFHTFDLGCDLLDMVLFISTLRLLIRNELYIYIYIYVSNSVLGLSMANTHAYTTRVRIQAAERLISHILNYTGPISHNTPFGCAYFCSEYCVVGYVRGAFLDLSEIGLLARVRIHWQRGMVPTLLSVGFRGTSFTNND